MPTRFNPNLISAGSVSTSDLCLCFTCKYCQIFGTRGRGWGVVLCASSSQKIDRCRIDKKANVTITAVDSFP